MKCTYCGRPIEAETAARGINTGKPYCPDKYINACNSAYGKKAGQLMVKDWKATVVYAK